VDSIFVETDLSAHKEKKLIQKPCFFINHSSVWVVTQLNMKFRSKPHRTQWEIELEDTTMGGRPWPPKDLEANNA